MKKIFIGLLLSLSLTVPFIAHADTVLMGDAYVTQIQQMAQIAQLKTELISLITQLIANLQAQIDTLKTQQTAQLASQTNPITDNLHQINPTIPTSQLNAYATVAPTITFSNNSLISGTFYLRSDMATKPDGEWLDKLDFYIDGTLFSSLPFGGGDAQLKVDSNQFSNGNHDLMVKAYDKYGNVGVGDETIDIQN